MPSCRKGIPSKSVGIHLAPLFFLDRGRTNQARRTAPTVEDSGRQTEANARTSQFAVAGCGNTLAAAHATMPEQWQPTRMWTRPADTAPPFPSPSHPHTAPHHTYHTPHANIHQAHHTTNLCQKKLTTCHNTLLLCEASSPMYARGRGAST